MKSLPPLLALLLLAACGQTGPLVLPDAAAAKPAPAAPPTADPAKSKP